MFVHGKRLVSYRALEEDQEVFTFPATFSTLAQQAELEQTMVGQRALASAMRSLHDLHRQTLTSSLEAARDGEYLEQQRKHLLGWKELRATRRQGVRSDLFLAQEEKLASLQVLMDQILEPESSPSATDAVGERFREVVVLILILRYAARKYCLLSEKARELTGVEDAEGGIP